MISRELKYAHEVNEICDIGAAMQVGGAAALFFAAAIWTDDALFN